MSDALIVRRGGSGGLPAHSAVIHVSATPGSTITFSKGGVIVKALGPEKSHVNADDNTVADWYYSVSSSNYGTWTVTATLGTGTDSKTVTVDSNKEYDVELPYDLVLFENGVWAPVTGGVTDSANYSIVDGEIKTDWTYSSVGKWRTVNKIDTTRYTVLHIRCKITGYDTSGRTLWFGTSATTNTPSSVGSWGSSLFNAYLSYTASAVDEDFVDRVVDVSGVSETSYVKFGAFMNVFASKIWLSR